MHRTTVTKRWIFFVLIPFPTIIFFAEEIIVEQQKKY